jgi:hypothetical protein
MTLLETVLSTLRDEYTGAGKGQQFDVLKKFIGGRQQDGGYDDVAGQLGLSVNAVRVAAHRLRTRYRELLKAQIAHTVADPAEIEDEIRNLFDVMAR